MFLRVMLLVIIAPIGGHSGGILSVPSGSSNYVRLVEIRTASRGGDGAEGADARAEVPLWQERRRRLTAEAEKSNDPELLRRWAESEDAFGSGAAAWQRFSESAPAAERQAALRRGFIASLRDGDPKIAAWFVERMDKRPVAAPVAGAATGSLSIVPGGVRALAFVAHGKPGVPAEFLLNYSRTIAEQESSPNASQVAAYRDSLDDYFRKLAEFRRFGQSKSGETVIRLAVAGKEERRHASQVLQYMGYRFRTSKKGITVEAGTKGDQGRRQGILAALGVDEVEMVRALEAGEPFEITIRDQEVPMLFDEATWAREYSTERVSIVQLLSRTPRLAKVYAGLAAAGPRSAHFLVSAFGIRQLADRYAARLFLYGSALGVAEAGSGKPERMLVPGGDGALNVWRTLAGVSPEDPLPFIKTLMTRDEGRLLAWYQFVGQLTRPRQQFFTGSPERAQAFYALFKDAPELAMGVDRRLRETPVLDFLRQIPLNNDGSVAFPGGPQVWQVAKGTSDTAQLQRLTRRMERAKPADEDEILTRLMRQKYEIHRQQRSQASNFVAVARIEAARRQPLTAMEALLLTQQFSRAEGTYPYFMTLTTLGEPEFRSFFAFADAMAGQSDRDRHLAAGLFHSTTKLLCLLVEAGHLDATAAGKLFGRLCDALTRTGSRGAWASEVAALVEEALGKPGSAGENLRTALYGPETEGAPLGGRMILISAIRRREMKRNLEFQKIPDLDQMLLLIQQASALESASGADAAKLAAAIGEGWSRIPAPERPKHTTLEGDAKDVLAEYAPKEIAQICRETQRKASAKKPNPQDMGRASRALLEHLAAPLQLALTGIVYAHYLRPLDLTASEDPWLVRKHQFTSWIGSPERFGPFDAAEFHVESSGLGSYGTGSLAGMSSMIARVAVAGHEAGGDFGEHVFGSQVASIRSSQLRRLTESDLRLLHLRVLLGREWVLECLLDRRLRPPIETALTGRVAAARTAALFGGLAAHDWASIDDNLSLSDLHWLGESAMRLPEALRWPSPVWKAIAEVSRFASVERLDLLGPVVPDETGSYAPMLVPLPPYEDFEKKLFPARVGDRLGEFKLNVALLADKEGLAPALLEVLTEPLLERIMTGLEMSDSHDWASVLRAYRSVSAEMVEGLRLNERGSQ